MDTERSYPNKGFSPDFDRWTEGGPPISGGSGEEFEEFFESWFEGYWRQQKSPKEKIPRLTRDVSSEEAKRFFHQAFESAPELLRWGQRGRNRRENRMITTELVRLRNLYPDEYKRVASEFGLEVDE